MALRDWSEIASIFTSLGRRFIFFFDCKKKPHGSRRFNSKLLRKLSGARLRLIQPHEKKRREHGNKDAPHFGIATTWWNLVGWERRHFLSRGFGLSHTRNNPAENFTMRELQVMSIDLFLRTSETSTHAYLWLWNCSVEKWALSFGLIKSVHVLGMYSCHHERHRVDIWDFLGSWNGLSWGYTCYSYRCRCQRTGQEQWNTLARSWSNLGSPPHLFAQTRRLWYSTYTMYKKNTGWR